jgi:hypothetical protein
MADKGSWEGQCADAAYIFGLRCAELRKSNPYKEDYGQHMYGPQSDLEFFIGTLATELWDRNFSLTEIQKAFAGALETLPEYARNLDRRDQGPH